MKRLILAVVASLALPSAALAQHPIEGFSLPDAAHLEDSILGPGAPVPIAWDGALQGWKGAGNGVEYRVVRESAAWKVRVIIPAGDFALAWSLVARPGQVAGMTGPAFRDPAGGGSGPLMAMYGNVGYVTIKLTP